MAPDKVMTNELVKLLRGGSAHAGLNDALKDLPANLRGQKIDRLPYTIWQLLEHIRIAQKDMLDFSSNENHVSPVWPDEYWPQEAAPADDDTWNHTISRIKKDLEEFIGLIRSGDIYKDFPHGDGQTLLREALQMADHNAYHIAEIIMMRRLFDAWK